METSYWHRQTASNPYAPDADWLKPERRDQAGKLGIIGGNTLGFVAIAEAYQTALQTGAGQVRAVLPDALKPLVPKTITDVVYGATTPSGSLGSDANAELATVANWADGVLLIGDAGRNAETAILYEQFIAQYVGPLTITRDAIDLIKNNQTVLAERENTIIVASFAQTQKLLQQLYFPKILTFNMQLMQLVETLHKFTITYPCTIVTLHKDTLVMASGGEIVTQEWGNAMAIWRGSVATNIATHWLWQPTKPLNSIAASIYSS